MVFYLFNVGDRHYIVYSSSKMNTARNPNSKVLYDIISIPTSHSKERVLKFGLANLFCKIWSSIQFMNERRLYNLNTK